MAADDCRQMVSSGVAVAPYEGNAGFVRSVGSHVVRTIYREEIEKIDEPDEDGHDRQLRGEELLHAGLSLDGGKDEALFGPFHGRDVGGLFHPPQDADSLVVAPLLGEETDRFRQKVAEKGDENKGQKSEKEHDPPSVGGDEQHRDHARQGPGLT